MITTGHPVRHNRITTSRIVISHPKKMISKMISVSVILQKIILFIFRSGYCSCIHVSVYLLQDLSRYYSGEVSDIEKVIQ